MLASGNRLNKNSIFGSKQICS